MTDSTANRSDKERDAVNLNIIEERLLLKAIQTLDLEKSYQLKLIDLEKKQVKYSQKSMRTKVKKIKTFLDPADIAEMKTQEIEGRFKPEYTPMTTSGLIRILSASKRLKLMTNEELEELVDKDLKRPLMSEVTSIAPLCRATTPAPGLLRSRSKSLPRELNTETTSQASHYESKKFPIMTRRSALSSSSEDLLSTQRLSNGRASRMSKQTEGGDNVDGATPDNADNDANSMAADRQSTVRQNMNIRASGNYHGLTTKGFLAPRPNTEVGNAAKPPIAPRPKTSLGIPKRGLNYSSHKVKVESDRCRRESILSTSSIGSEIAREKATEVRKELLNNEQITTASIESKRQAFLTRISTWIDKTEADMRRPSPRKRSTLLSTDISGLLEPEASEEDKAAKEWRDLKKCRYLRHKEGEEDFSGVTTLVRDQLKMFQNLRPFPLNVK